jgi:peptidoglycan/LPS O-acetylase OafA/YrhL
MRYIPAMDGLRGIAILMVIAFHYFSFVPFFSLGWAGVDLFFVLSGYLITGRLLATMDRFDYFTRFYRNRVLRIFPLYFTILISFYIVIRFAAKPSTQPLLAWYYSHWKSYFLFTINWTFIRYGLPKGAWLTHFWSLSVEEQFYLVWPFFIFCLRRTKHRLRIFAALFLAVLTARCICYHYDPEPDNRFFYYYNTFFRLDSLLIGALLCQLHVQKMPLPSRLVSGLFVGSMAVLVTRWALSPPDPWDPFFETIGYSIIAILGACLIHFSVKAPQKITARIFSNKVLRFVGKISYGLYLIHFLILQIFFSRFHDWYASRLPGPGLTPSIFASLLCLLITLILACLSFYFFESPFLQLKKGDGLPGKLREMAP